MSPKEKKAFVARMKKGRKNAKKNGKKSKSKSIKVKALESRIEDLEIQLKKLADIQGGGMGYAGTEYHDVLTRIKKQEHTQRKRELSDELKRELESGRNG